MSTLCSLVHDYNFFNSLKIVIFIIFGFAVQDELCGVIDMQVEGICKLVDESEDQGLVPLGYVRC
jgi:hypothetical protein